MILSTLKENLKHGLSVVGHIAGKNVNLPILNNIMVSVKKEGVKLITTNLEIGVTHTVRGKVDEECDFTVDSKVFSDYINLLPNKKINITKEKESDDLKVECENYKTKIRTQASEDFPLIPQIERLNKITCKIKDLKKTLSQVVFAVSGNESRVELSGVLFNFNKNKLTLAATDSYRLAESKIDIEQEKETEESIIIPARTIQELIRIMSQASDLDQVKNIDIYISEGQILFIVDSTELISRIIEGQYPDYKQIIPQAGKTSAVVNRGEIIRAVKASSLFSKTGVNDINLDFPSGGNSVVVSSASGNTGESVVEVEANTKGLDNGMIVNYQYLLDGLNNIEDENIIMEVIDNNTPCILRPEKDKNYLYIIMPIKQ